MTDLRTFLERVRETRRSDLLEIDHEVDPRYETAAILTKLEERQRSPILQFRRVKGCALPLVTNVCGSMGRLAMALGCSLKDVATRYAQAAEQQIASITVGEAPCQQVVLAGDAVDLGMFPQLVYHADDADAPYITAAIVVARDPETHRTNLSYHRLMIAGRNRTGIYMEKGRHLDAIFGKYVAQGQDMPVAVFIGAHPAWSLGALYAGSADVEEYDVIGGLLGEPLEVVASTIHPDLPVPARTEIVLEGHVSHRDTIAEGPFGEFTGYGTGVTRTPVLHVEAITHRREPVFQDIVSGHMEHLVLSMPALEHRTLREARKVTAGVSRVALVAPLSAVIALRKTDDEEPRRLIEALLEGDIYSKQVIVVDDDVDPNDLRAVMSAMALQTQADRAVHVLPDRQGTPLDPSCSSAEGRTAKLGIDATRPLRAARAVTRNRIAQDVLDRIDVAALLRRR
jgi:2,5-furandicarboxylate decarboxylase 1